MLLCEFGLYSKDFIALKSDSSDLGIIDLVLAMFREKPLSYLPLSTLRLPIPPADVSRSALAGRV